MTIRRWRVLVGGFGALIVALATTAVLRQTTMDDATITLDSARIASCLPVDHSDVTKLTHGVIYGLDYVTLASGSSVIVTSVDMVKPQGGMSLAHVQFVPGGSVGDGPADKGLPTFFPAVAKYARVPPTTLARTVPPPEFPKGVYTSDGWQLVVTLTAPRDAQNAAVSGFVIHYWTGNRMRSLTTQDSVRMGLRASICD